MGFKPFQGWFPILTPLTNSKKCLYWKFQTLPGMISYSDKDTFDISSSGFGFKPFQGWFPILTKNEHWFYGIGLKFQTLPGMISYSDDSGRRHLGRTHNVSNPSRDDFLFWLQLFHDNSTYHQTVSNPSRDDFLFWPMFTKLYPIYFNRFKPFQGWFPILTLK